MKKNITILSLLTLGFSLGLTGCGVATEEPAGGVSIEDAENQTLGFTYLYDLGNGYKLYADNFTKIVYLRYDYQGGKGATSIGSSSMCPYISTNGNYYKVNPQTRVIEEYNPSMKSTNSNVDTNDTENQDVNNSETENTQQEENNSSNSQKQDIEAILNENSQKNQNSNNQQKQESKKVIKSQSPEDNTTEVTQTDNDKAVSTQVENTENVENTETN